MKRRAWNKQTMAEHLVKDHDHADPGSGLVELRKAHTRIHEGKPHPPAEPKRRPISGWVMIPVHVTVDAPYGDQPRIVKANAFYEYTRPARNDLDDDGEFFEPAHRVEDDWGVRYEGVTDQADADAYGIEGWQRVQPDEKAWWEQVMYEDLERYMEDLWPDMGGEL